MKYSLAVLTAAGLLLYPFAAFADDYGSQPSQTQQPPPVAQTLIREGDFAIKLAAKFNFDSLTDEALAENELAKVGITPLNGWLSDYPVTPEIVGQLQTAVAQAAAEGKLPMTTNDATGRLYALTVSLNLPTPSAPEGTAAAASQPAPQFANQTPTVVSNYYIDQGPPIITYYPPPYDYVYLYDWVPYPVYWYGFWFSGFYICHNFTTTVIVSNRPNRPLDRDRDGDRDDNGRHRIITNRVIDPTTRNVAIVSPAYRTSGGVVRPVTTLRTRNGGMFTTIDELGRANRMPVRTGENQGSMANGAGRSDDRFRSDEARKSAASLYSRSIARTGSGVFRQGETTGGSEKRDAAARSIERTHQSQMLNNGSGSSDSWKRSYREKTRSADEDKDTQSQPGSDKSYNAPSRGNDWRTSSPTAPSRQNNFAPILKSDGGVVKPSSRGGWRFSGKGGARDKVHFNGTGSGG